jgi:type IV secretion system protein VirD4
VQIIFALLVLVLMQFEGEERNLSSVQEMASDPKLLFAAADALRDIGGIPARLGNQLRALFADGVSMQLSREGASIMSSVQKFMGFLDSPSAARAVARTTFPLDGLWDAPGTSMYLQVGLDRLEVYRPLLRCWLTTLIRIIGRSGDERKTQVLFLLDEFSALVGNGLRAVEEALVRGRQAGIRLAIVCQSDSQVKAAFKQTPELIYDNCSTHIYLPPSSIETAERLSKCLGDFTQVVESAADSESTSRQDAVMGAQNSSRSMSLNWNRNWQPQGRPLMRPDELLRMSREHLIVLIAGMPPILARRVKFFADPMFVIASRFSRFRSALWWGLLSAAVVSVMWAVLGGQ